MNILIALTDKDHQYHLLAQNWLSTPNLDWGVCAFTEAGFLRVATHPRYGSHSMEGATAILRGLVRLPGYRFWAASASWIMLAAPFKERIFGHQQVTDAYLLGLAVKENGILVTLDKAIGYLAGPDYREHVLLLG